MFSREKMIYQNLTLIISLSMSCPSTGQEENEGRGELSVGSHIAFFHSLSPPPPYMNLSELASKDLGNMPLKIN